MTGFLLGRKLICTLRAPGEAPELTGGIFEVFVLGIHDLADGKRMLVQMDNTAGGTPYTVDRELRRDVLWIFHTLRWTSSSMPSSGLDSPGWLPSSTGALELPPMGPVAGAEAISEPSLYTRMFVPS